MMSAYYNETDPYAAQWLRNLISAGHIAPGEVDERSIIDVKPDEIRYIKQCHFFAGIGGWSYALRLAGWPDERPVWTGSCPCQPFSSATSGAGRRKYDERHLWPAWFSLIAECTPSTLFGEQVAQAGDWFDGVCSPMEKMGYAIGAAILPAVAVGKDHARPRLYFVSHPYGNGEPIIAFDDEARWMQGHRSVAVSMGDANGISPRVAQLRAFGNSIVPQVAAEFVSAYMEQT